MNELVFSTTNPLSPSFTHFNFVCSVSVWSWILSLLLHCIQSAKRNIMHSLISSFIIICKLFWMGQNLYLMRMFRNSVIDFYGFMCLVFKPKCQPLFEWVTIFFVSLISFRLVGMYINRLVLGWITLFYLISASWNKSSYNIYQNRIQKHFDADIHFRIRITEPEHNNSGAWLIYMRKHGVSIQGQCFSFYPLANEK